ncbi:MAG: hypothetical protein WCJ81_07745 [bacterium]
MDVPITRYESALFLYRVIGAIQKASNGTGTVEVTGNATSGSTTTDSVKSLV